MINFDAEYKKLFKDKCPAFLNDLKSSKCLKDLELNGIEPDENKCKLCWRAYIEKEDDK